MNKTIKIYIVLLVFLFAGAAAIEFTREEPIDWNRSFDETDKIPYGTFIFYEELKNLFPESDVKTIKTTPYEYFDALYNFEDSIYNTSGTYMAVNNFSGLDDVSSQELLDFAAHGNDVFIASHFPSKNIQDSLGVDIKSDYNFKGKALFNFANPNFRTDSITVEKGLGNYYFTKLDSATTTVLGYQKFDSIQNINFVKVEYGAGNFYLHLQPIVFTNYHLLKKNNKKYAEAALSYAENDTIHFDSVNKIGQDLGSSPLRFILKTPALRWAWYLALFTMVCFMIFNAKRRQRIVKIIKPNENTTVAFTKTIGNLYYETKEHDTIIDKKITYFLEFLRREYFLDTQILDEKFIKNLSLKSNKKEDTIKRLINLILQLKAKRHLEEADLLRLNKAIEAFYNK
ncbi:DUF4350 domain-containing protein [Algibacter lectus]|uniref:Uncharacterized protein DUF4350 n=1 Tax=Algibacter lectus TaxID=221126 RepID=A0A4R8M7E2_9FLAO|nr:DUF4350 domain-containing protein [Algibacter lectus]MWW25409.1 DUF4350 domain-containing protein [Algibacter lectus]TDY61353.1 uncharacterized protein DUF4350 [Algibacter lectus]